MTSCSPWNVDVLTSWDALPAQAWRDVVHPDRDHVFLTPEYQRAWWEVLSPGELLLITVADESGIVAIAPLFAAGRMGFFVGSGGSDYLDFVGQQDRPGALVAMLRAARDQIPDFVGFRFHHVPDSSPTGELLRAVAPELGLACFDEGEMAAPRLSMSPEHVAAVTGKKSLRRHENWLRSNGELEVLHLSDGAEIQAALPELFEQHRQRWSGTPYPSLFESFGQEDLYREVARAGAAAGWLRFTKVIWNGQAVALHLGFCHAGNYLWYKPSFDPTLARRSPGEVLLRHLVLAAADEGVSTFDFGLGDEPFKRRFATEVEHVRTWGLYPEAAT